jgi:predicted outer membrane repeat protein
MATTVSISGGQGNSMVLSGFTIKSLNCCNAYSLKCDNSSPTVQNCHFISTVIIKNMSSPILDGCYFTSDTIADVRPGGMLIENSSPIIKECKFELCKSNRFGGAIGNHAGSNTKINSCEFIKCQADIGGAICNSSKLTVTNSDFEGNSSRYGGAIYNIGSYSEYESCNFTNNSASNSGGAICNDGQAIIMKLPNAYLITVHSSTILH